MPGSVEEDWIRRHADYLADSPSGMLVALGVVARVLLLSLLFLFGPAIVLGVLVGQAFRVVPMAQWGGSATLDPAKGAPVYPDVRTGTVYLLAVLAGLALATYLLSVIMNRKLHGPRAFRLDRHPVGIDEIARGLTKGLPRGRRDSSGDTLTCLRRCLAAPTFRLRREDRRLHRHTRAQLWRDAPREWQATRPPRPSGTGSSRSAERSTRRRQARCVSCSFAVTLLLLGVAWLLLFGGSVAVADEIDSWMPWTTLVIFMLLFFTIDQTSLSLHPFYRRRLARAFALRRIRPTHDMSAVADGYDYAEVTTLSKYGEPSQRFRHEEAMFPRGDLRRKRQPLR